MNINYLPMLCIATLVLSGCTTEQLGNAAYGNAKSRECMDKHGTIMCDLDERSQNEKLLNGAPPPLTNEELEAEAKKIHKKNEKQS